MSQSCHKSTPYLAQQTAVAIQADHVARSCTHGKYRGPKSATSLKHVLFLTPRSCVVAVVQGGQGSSRQPAAASKADYAAATATAASAAAVRFARHSLHARRCTLFCVAQPQVHGGCW